MAVNEKQRPYILLKWAQTANGIIGYRQDDNKPALQLSTPFTKMLVHKLRAEYDAILVGRVTDDMEHPQLNVRDWAGKNPKRLVLDHSTSPQDILDKLYAEKAQSLIVEGGAKTLSSFIELGLWDEIRVETAPFTVEDGVMAPTLPKNVVVESTAMYGGNTIMRYIKKVL